MPAVEVALSDIYDKFTRRQFIHGSAGVVATAALASDQLRTGGAAATDTTEQGSDVLSSNLTAISQFNVKVPMRDGVNLSADIYRPKAPGKFPTLLLRTYFDNSLKGKVEFALKFVEQGYAVVLQDVRGRFDSDGAWQPYQNEPKDGYDTQEWIGKQSWCNGKIGCYGTSYDGFTTIMPAPLHSEYVKCMVPTRCQQTCFGHLYNDGVMQINVVFMAGVFYDGRSMQPTLAQSLGHDPKALRLVDWNEVFRRVPLITAVDDIIGDPSYIKEWIQHPQFDEYWKSYGLKDKYADIKSPAYFLTGWYDNLLLESLRNFVGFREKGGSPEARNGTKILIGPWTHGIVDPKGHGWDVDLGQNTTVDTDAVHLKYFDHYLKGVDNGIDQQPPIRLFVMGANRWRDENEWPLARTKWTNYYFGSGGHANTLNGDGTLTLSSPRHDSTPDKYVYDPNDPVPSLGGLISMPAYLQGPKDRRSVEQRKDVLVYTTPPLETDTEVTGPIEVKLYAASSAVDTDFTGTLIDVYPDGRAINICEGIRGARYRESLENPTLIEPGKVYEYSINLWGTSNVFKAGHRIRVEISSSNFPRFARNQNVGAAFGTSAEIKTAEQTIYHDSRYQSRLILPVIPA